MRRKYLKNILSFILLFVGLLSFRFVFAQADFGTEPVNQGLGGVLGSDDPRTMIGRVINLGLGFLGVIALGLMIYAGFLWMTSGGEQDKVSQAKKLLTSAVIGLAIILASWAIATFVISRLSGAMNGDNGNNVYCTDGQVSSCGCDGAMVCSNGTWGGCVGGECTGPGPRSCDSNPNPGCQAAEQICAESDYCDTDCTCKPRAEAGSSCDGNKATPTCDANNNLCGAYLSCEESSCTCVGTPVITGITPVGGFCAENHDRSCTQNSDCLSTCDLVSPNGAANNLLSISGKNFGTFTNGSSIVTFLGGDDSVGRNPSEINPVCVNFWQDDQIIIAVPNGASTGPIMVTANGNSDTTDNDIGPRIPDFVSNNISRPGLCSINPNSGPLSSQVTYQGVNLYRGNAYFGNYQTNVQGFDSNFNHASGLSGTAGTPNIRNGIASSFVINNISGNQERSNLLKFTKQANPEDGPYIVSFYPQSGRAGQYVTITGSGFGWSRANSHVYFGNQEAVYDFPAICASSVWNDNQIIVKVPEGVANGNQLIRITIGDVTIDSSEANPNVFLVNDALSLRSSICKIEPNKGTVSTPVKIYGEYFGQVNRDGLVQFSNERNVYGTITNENRADLIQVEVPTSTITGPVRVVKNGEWGNQVNFEISSCQVDADCPNQVCCPSNTYKKGRCENTLAECLNDIPTSVFEWRFNTGYANNNPDSQESCQTLAKYYGSCQTGAFCPNAPGTCSPNAGGTRRTVGRCDFSCASVEGCRTDGLGSSCIYNEEANRCVREGLGGTCDVSQVQTFNLGGRNVDFNVTCNGKNWVTVAANTSCPDGWQMRRNNVCEGPVCNTCPTGLSCEQVGPEMRCVSPELCPNGSTCENNIDNSQPDNCIKIDEPSCDCCCRKDQQEQDCCAALDPDTGENVQLQCQGACGVDQTGNSNLGRCGGCASVGDTQAEHDAACNCSGHSGQYCSITPENPGGICTDCSGLAGLASCSEHNTACCFDAKRTENPADDICRGVLGDAVITDETNPDFGYCGYFDCDANNSQLCASSTMVKIGYYKDVYSCEDGCASDEPQDVCSSFNGNQQGCLGSGSCCYDTATATCSGAKQRDSEGRPICCGCTKDSDCEATPSSLACGADSCCANRPNIISTSPRGASNNICRNTILQATFDQTMDTGTFNNNNVILLQEMDYGGQTCPPGTFAYDTEAKYLASSQTWLNRVFGKVKRTIARFFGTNNNALADLPDPTKLYCSFPGNVSGENIGTTTSLLTFSPRQLLEANTKYFLIIKGDEDLNSQTGITNAGGIGFNGRGLDLVGDMSSFTEGEDPSLTFNSKTYKNSHILQFKTLADSRDNNHGVCLVDKVKITPSSYLFKTVENDLDEDDTNAGNVVSFDTKGDKDKVFTANAYSGDNQIIQPVTGYFWDWQFEFIDPSLFTASAINNLGPNKIFTSVNPGISDGRTKLRATIDMTRYLDAGASTDPNCVCNDETCTNRCQNAYSQGDALSGYADLYALICTNPWPPIRPDGTWAPWGDNCNNAIGTCVSFGDTIYYCRDAGQPGEFDDLPLLIDEAVIRGVSNNFTCSSDNSQCFSAGSLCGPDRNGDGNADGVCIWNVLKEYFFFREQATPSGQITEAVDRATGGVVSIAWLSIQGEASSYKIYYGEKGKALSMVREVARNSSACQTREDGQTECRVDISNLKNGQEYSFFLAVVATNNVESPLSSGRNATPTDKLAPRIPLNFQIQDSTSTIRFSWAANPDDTLFYRIYRGTRRGAYGESFDTIDKVTSTSLDKDRLNLGENFFAISAIDRFNNESQKSTEVIYTRSR